MSLARDPTKKMRNVGREYGKLHMPLDTPDQILKKFKRAVTDSEAWQVRYAEGKDGINNPMGI